MSSLISGCKCVNHSWDKIEVVSKPTCLEDGYSKHTCTKCGSSKYESIYREGHDFEQESIIKMKTCTEDGYSMYKCNKCGETEERSVPASHSLVDNVCSKCNARVSDNLPNEWYYITSNEVVKFQNAEIYNSVPMSKGTSFLVTYYPVCKNCQVCGMLKMSAVGPNTPISETHLCKYCNEITYVRFKVEY